MLWINSPGTVHCVLVKDVLSIFTRKPNGIQMSVF